MKRVFALLITCSVISPSLADEVRYFLSFEGLSDSADTDSPAIPPRYQDDPFVKVIGQSRIYIWAQLLTPGSDLKSVDLAFRSEGNWVIHQVNIWQNNFVPAITKRWNDNGVPGVTNPDVTGQFVDPPPSVAVSEAGVTNGAFAALDDQWIAFLGAAVIGSIDFSGDYGALHIISQGTGFMNTAGNHRVYLGWDDNVGAPVDFMGQPYDNPSPEASIPEPATLALLLAGMSAMGRRR